MLTLTNNAALVITSITDRPEVPDGSGIRIAADVNDMNSLELVVAPTPTDGDQVVEERGARVFLEPNASTLLDEMVLDADVDDQGQAQFFLAAQADVDGDVQSDGQPSGQPSGQGGQGEVPPTA